MKNLIGQVFGRLTVVKDSGERDPLRSYVLWLCKCSCGKRCLARSQVLLNGTKRSCGCLYAESLKTRRNRLRHGESTGDGRDTPEYHAWQGLKGRCLNPSNEDFAHYGGRGIKVCARWQSSYENFLADMGRKPSPEHSLDRINNDGNYEPGNCRWATYTEQNNNRRKNETDVRLRQR